MSVITHYFQYYVVVLHKAHGHKVYEDLKKVVL